MPRPVIIKQLAQNDANIRFPCHALYRMLERNIGEDEIRNVVINGKYIGSYNHRKGRVYGYLYDNIKVFTALRRNKVFVITVYKV